MGKGKNTNRAASAESRRDGLASETDRRNLESKKEKLKQLRHLLDEGEKVDSYTIVMSALLPSCSTC